MNQTLSVRAAFGIVLLSVLSALIIGTIFGALDPSTLSNAKPGLSTYLSMFVGQGFLMVPVLFYLRKKRLPLASHLRIRPVSIKIVLATSLLALGSIILAEEINILVGYVLPLPDSFLQLEELLNPDGFLAMGLLITTVVFLAPVGEELVFRGFLQKFLEKSWGDVTRAVLFTSLFFAVIHLNPYWLVQIYLLGVLLGYIAWKTDSILPGILFHILINGSSLLFTSWGELFESVFLWKEHVSPIFLLPGVVLFWAGFKKLHGTHRGIA